MVKDKVILYRIFLVRNLIFNIFCINASFSNKIDIAKVINKKRNLRAQNDTKHFIKNSTGCSLMSLMSFKRTNLMLSKVSYFSRTSNTQYL